MTDKIRVIQYGLGPIGSWTAGLIDERDTYLAQILPFVAGGAVVIFSCVHELNALTTGEDIAAMEWIRGHTEPDALFAVNTYFWLPHHPHGTDAGYWIPYFTGRQMTAAVMLLSGATPEYKLGQKATFPVPG